MEFTWELNKIGRPSKSVSFVRRTMKLGENGTFIPSNLFWPDASNSCGQTSLCESGRRLARINDADNEHPLFFHSIVVVVAEKLVSERFF